MLCKITVKILLRYTTLAVMSGEPLSKQMANIWTKIFDYARTDDSLELKVWKCAPKLVFHCLSDRVSLMSSYSRITLP